MTKVNYDEMSKVYDQVREADVQLLRAIIEQGEITKESVVLDIGCGTGNYTNLLQQVSRAQVFGVDGSPGMVQQVQEKNPAIEVRIADVSREALPFGDGCFDLIYMTDVIHHIADVKHLFGEICRVLKSRGKVCIGTQSHRQIQLRYTSEFFPATARVDQGRYPDISDIVTVGRDEGLSHVRNQVICEGDEVKLGLDYLELLEKKGYSMLHLISDEDYQQGLAAFKSLLNGQDFVQRKSAGGTLIWFEKN